MVSVSMHYRMALLPAYVRLPHGVDQDEWLATHSELLRVVGHCKGRCLGLAVSVSMHYHMFVMAFLPAYSTFSSKW